MKGRGRQNIKAPFSSSWRLRDVSHVPTDVYSLRQNPGQVREGQDQAWTQGHGGVTEVGQVSPDVDQLF